MSVAKLSKYHNYLIGYILACVDKRQMYSYEIAFRSELAAKLNNQSVNVRYNEHKHSVKIDINECHKIDFRVISNAQKAKSIDAYLYNSDNAKGFDKSPIVAKLKAYRETLDFNQSDYDAVAWFVEDLPLIQPKSHDEFKAEYARIHCVSAKW